jgi:hypothetical protein
MAPDRQKRALEILDAAFDLNPGEQAAFLIEACRGDDELRSTVEALLAAEQEAATVIESPTETLTPDRAAVDEATGNKPLNESLAGRIVGPYQILWLLGAGGMGEIYLAAVRKGAPGLGGTGESSAAYLNAMSGRRAEALETVEKLKQTSRRTFVAPTQIALIYSGLRDIDNTIEWLERAYEDKVTGMIYLKVDPKYDWIRSNPRFIDLVRRMKLAA